MAEAHIALGYTAASSREPPLALTTVHLDADFAGAARVGDWVEARVEVQRIGSRPVFAGGFLAVGGERIVRASAVFARNPGEPAGATPPAERSTP